MKALATSAGLIPLLRAGFRPASGRGTLADPAQARRSGDGTDEGVSRVGVRVTAEWTMNKERESRPAAGGATG